MPEKCRVPGPLASRKSSVLSYLVFSLSPPGLHSGLAFADKRESERDIIAPAVWWEPDRDLGHAHAKQRTLQVSNRAGPQHLEVPLLENHKEHFEALRSSPMAQLFYFFLLALGLIHA